MSEETAAISRESVVTLREITNETLWPVLQLSKTLSELQRTHVADNAVSIAEAHFEPHAWFRGDLCRPRRRSGSSCFISVPTTKTGGQPDGVVPLALYDRGRIPEDGLRAQGAGDRLRPGARTGRAVNCW